MRKKHNRILILFLVSVWMGLTGISPVYAGDVQTLTLRFDDRYSFPSDISLIEVLEITSRKTGTNEPDATVLKLDADNRCRVTAAGCGKARVTLTDGSAIEVNVTAAPLTMVMIAGQSNGEGRPSDTAELDLFKDQQLLCKEGTVYGSYGPSDEYGQDMYREVAWYEDIEQIGQLSEENARRFIPVSLYDNSQNDIYCKTNRLTDAPDAGGKGGPDAAFAYKWNSLTGEKVWVINTCHHGCRIQTWNPESDEGVNYREALAMFQAAEEVLSREITAGHYELRHKGILWNQGENNRKMTGSKYLKYLKKVIAGFWSDLAGTGIPGVEREPDFFGILLARTGPPEPSSLADYELLGPRRAQFFAASSEKYPNVYMASQVLEEWSTDESVSAYFTGKYGSQEAFEAAYPVRGDYRPMPQSVGEVRKNIHYTQLAYNEIGMDAAVNLCYELGYVKTPEDPVIRLLAVTDDGLTDRAGSVLSREGRTKIPFAVKVFPAWLTKELTVTVSEGAKYKAGEIRLSEPGTVDIRAEVRGVAVSLQITE